MKVAPLFRARILWQLVLEIISRGRISESHMHC